MTVSRRGLRQLPVTRFDPDSDLAAGDLQGADLIAEVGQGDGSPAQSRFRHPRGLCQHPSDRRGEPGMPGRAGRSARWPGIPYADPSTLFARFWCCSAAASSGRLTSSIQQ